MYMRNVHAQPVYAQEKDMDARPPAEKQNDPTAATAISATSLELTG